MSSDSYPMTSRFRAVFLAILLAALVTLSFHGWLDRFAYDQVVATTAESVLLYTVSKAINAGTSVLQSANVDIIITGLQVGELLDPVNDAIERLSAALAWSIGSLFLQRLILEFTFSNTFQWVFFASFVMVFVIYLPSIFRRILPAPLQMFGISEVVILRYQNLFVRIFIVATIARFIVPTFLATSFIFSQILLETHLEENKEKLRAVSNQISLDAESSLLPPDQLTLKKSEVESQIADMQRDRLELQQQHGLIQKRIQSLNEKAGWRRFIPGLSSGRGSEEDVDTGRPVGGDLHDRTEELKIRIDTKEKQIRQVELRIIAVKQERMKIQRQHDAMEQKMQPLNDNLGLRRFLPDQLGEGKLGENFTSLLFHQEDLRGQMAALDNQINALEAEKDDIESQLGSIQQELSVTQEEHRAKEVHSLQLQHDLINNQIEAINAQIGVAQEELDCIELQFEGEQCSSWIEKIREMGKTGVEKMKAALGFADDIIVVVAQLLVGVVIQNIIFPLLFLFIFIKCSIPTARAMLRLTESFRHDARQLEGHIRRIDQGSAG